MLKVGNLWLDEEPPGRRFAVMLAVMKCSFHPGYQATTPDGQPHTAASISKIPLLKQRLMAEGLLRENDFVCPEPLDRCTLELIHTAEYLDKLESSTLSAAEQRRLGLQWSESLWMRSRLASAGTLLAARNALVSGMAANLAGGSHHAFPDHGEGFCVLNDVAIAIAKLRAEDSIKRALVIDLDVHQGNGTAAIFEDVPEVFTFSIHGARNYPAAKLHSTLDVALPDGVTDEQYLGMLRAHLPEVLRHADADIVFYVAGVDIAAGDRYGKLLVTEEGVRQRDRYVIESVRQSDTALAIVLAGGYAQTRARTAELHAHVFREAVAYERRHPPM